ncbi:MAG: PBSX family phage terminase large subunit [Defluviitaleaceae bacterium]|nr:PBSX family phage terminase large subunit [Defluviitaleaceae bacterium]
MEYVRFNEKQMRYLRGSLGFNRPKSPWLNVAEGGKRAGKNVLNIAAFALNLEASKDKIHMVAGVTKSCALLNIIDANGFGLVHFFEGRSRMGSYQGRQALFVDTMNGEKVVLVEGGGKANDAARIKGISLGMVYMTEANELHPSFFFEAIDRTLAAKERKIFLDLNSKQEGHWFYREFLDGHVKRGKGACGVNYEHFTIFDNGAIGEEALEGVLATYNKQSQWYKRDILGLRAGGSDAIYVGFGASHIVREGHEMPDFRYMSVGIDIGGRDATVATLVGITACGAVYIVDGYYHKQGDGDYMTHEKYADAIAQKIRVWADEYPVLTLFGGIFCESAEKMFRASLREALGRVDVFMQVHPSYKGDGVLERIRLFCMLINKNKLFVAEHLGAWVRAFEEAVWDTTASGGGVWRRLDNGSYPLDCLDAAEYAVVPLRRFVI